MSDYCHYKVLRIPFTKYFPDKDIWDFESKHLNIFHNQPGYFNIPATDNEEMEYLDFIIEYDYGQDAGDWGKSRNLKVDEMVNYYDLFRLLIPDIDMTDVKLVEYCYYNCCEAPDYYDTSNDPFYDLIPFINKIKPEDISIGNSNQF